MKFLIVILTLLFTMVAGAQSSSKTLTIGPKTNDNKVLKFNRNSSTPPQIRWSESATKLQFTNDGSNFSDLGSGSGGGGGGTNLLSDFNADFELASPPANWTSSGGTFVSDTTTELFGEQSGVWDSSASAQTLCSQAATIKRGMIGRTCEAQLYFRWPSGVASDIRMLVKDTGTEIATVDLNPTTGDNVNSAVLAFDCPDTATDTLQLCLESSVTNPAAITVDDAFLGSDRNTLQISQNSFIASGYIDSTANCQPARTNTALGAFATDADCGGVTVEYSKVGSLQTTDTDLIKFTMNSLPAGSYVATIMLMGASPGDWTFAMNDGTNTRGHVSGSGNGGAAFEGPVVIQAAFEYSSSGNRSFEVYGASSSGSIDIYNQVTTPPRRIYFYLTKSPIAPAEAITLETTGANWAGYHDSTCSWARTNTAYGDPTADASCALVQRTNSGFGTVTSSGSVLPNIVFTPKYVGKYYVCATLLAGTSSANSIGSFKLWDGTTTIAESQQNLVSGGSLQNSVSLCGVYSANSVSSTTLSIQTANSVGIVTMAAASPAASVIEWSIYPLSQGFPTPVFTELQNLVKAENGAMKMAAVKLTAGVCSVSPCSPLIGTEGVTSITRSVAGTYVVNFDTNYFADANSIVCQFTEQSNTNLIGSFNTYAVGSVNLVTRNTGGTATDSAMGVLCLGK